MTPAARLARIADMVDALSRTPVADLPRAIDALRMEVYRAERECAEPTIGGPDDYHDDVTKEAVDKVRAKAAPHLTGADIARQVIEETRKLVAP